MVSERAYQAALAHLEQDLDGFVGACFVDIEQRRALAAHSVRPEFDLAGTASAVSEMIQQQYRGLTTLQIHSQLEDIIVTLGDQLHVYHMIARLQCLFLIVDRDECNLALARVAAKTRTESLIQHTDVPTASHRVA